MKMKSDFSVFYNIKKPKSTTKNIKEKNYCLASNKKRSVFRYFKLSRIELRILIIRFKVKGLNKHFW